jgi:hypothetical protein
VREYGKNPNHPRVKFFEFNGEIRTIFGWAQLFGLSYQCVQSRLRYGTPLDKPKSRRGRPMGSIA